MKWAILALGILCPAVAYADNPGFTTTTFPASCRTGSAIFSGEKHKEVVRCNTLSTSINTNGIQVVQFAQDHSEVVFVTDVNGHVIRIGIHNVLRDAREGICKMVDGELVCGGGYDNTFVVVRAKVTGPPSPSEVDDVTEKECEIPDNLPPAPGEEPCPPIIPMNGQSEMDNGACQDMHRVQRTDQWVAAHRELAHRCYMKFDRVRGYVPHITQEEVLINKLRMGVNVMPDELDWASGH